MITFIKLTRARINVDSSALEPLGGVARYNVDLLSKYESPLVWVPLTNGVPGHYGMMPNGSVVYAVDANPDGGDYVMESPDEIDELILQAHHRYEVIYQGGPSF